MNALFLNRAYGIQDIFLLSLFPIQNKDYLELNVQFFEIHKLLEDNVSSSMIVFLTDIF